MTRVRKKTEEYRAIQRRYSQSEKGRATHVAAVKRYREVHRERTRAHDAVKYAVKKGRLERLPCHCGEAQTHAHHHNGYGPEHRLDVVWLCDPHHKEAHRAA